MNIDLTNLKYQSMIIALMDGGLEDTLQDMTETSYPFTKDELREVARSIGYNDIGIDWDAYETLPYIRP